MDEGAGQARARWTGRRARGWGLVYREGRRAALRTGAAAHAAPPIPQTTTGSRLTRDDQVQDTIHASGKVAGVTATEPMAPQEGPTRRVCVSLTTRRT